MSDNNNINNNNDLAAAGAQIIEEEEEEEEDNTSSKPHPLLLPSVVDILIHKFRSDDIQRCRLVCQQWNHAIRKKSSPFFNRRILNHLLPFLHTQSILPSRLVCYLFNQTIITSKIWKGSQQPPHEESHRTLRNRTAFTTPGDIKKFQKIIGNPPSNLPFAFTHFAFEELISLGDPTTQQFFKTYGQFIESLELDVCQWSLEDLRVILFQYCPNLENLKIGCGKVPAAKNMKSSGDNTNDDSGGESVNIMKLNESSEEEEGIPTTLLPHLKTMRLQMQFLDREKKPHAYVEQFLVELFSSCVNIQVLGPNYLPPSTGTWLTNFISTNQPPLLRKLKVLEFPIEPDIHVIRNLTVKQLPLSRLEIRVVKKDVTEEALHELLASLKDTLVDLKIEFFTLPLCGNEFISSKELRKLRKLELWGYGGQLDFLTELEELIELVVGYSNVRLVGQRVFRRRRDFKERLPKLERVVFRKRCSFWSDDDDDDDEEEEEEGG